ncbi:membrane protein [Lysinibacillus sp. PLM2]|nr:membrane protein [Lysinibacillus sp. PLM2]
MSNKTPVYGGQALLEGVMFGGKDHSVTAVRRKDESIEYFYAKKEKKPLLQKLKKVPFLRGNVALIESAGLGARHMQFSGDRYDVMPGEEEEQGQEMSKLQMILGVAVVGVLSFLFGKFVFTLVPVFLAELFSTWVPDKTGQILLETLFKLILLFGYLYFISMMPIIKRVFQYHGSEHKVINCYEAGLELTVENVQKQSRLHYRCGSSFILFTVVVGMFVYFLFPTDPLWLRVLIRILLIPVVIGISFEVLQGTNALRNIPVLKYLGYPGLWLQLLTTKEPKDDMVEVAICSFKKLHEVEKNPEIAKELAHD